MWELTEIHTQLILEQTTNHALSDTHDLCFVTERGLNIDLSKFWLAVSTQVFVAETFSDLVVTIKARNHQQLFKQLG